jgi:type IX secretion system PorP/SprF family membrane protein
MKNIAQHIIAIVCLLWTINAAAQDFHFSQYDALPMYYNPALTGQYANEKIPYRFSGTYRSQWQKLNGKPYSAIGAGYDMPFDRFGAGIVLINHISGASNFDTFQAMASGSYRITDKSSKNHFLTVGAQVGIYQKKFSQRDLLFENQYTAATGLDPTLPNGETLADMSILKFDANMGVWYKFVDPNHRFNPSLGISLYHLTQPNESFTGESSKLPMRWNAIFNTDIFIDQQWTVTPTVLFMEQAKAREINAGLIGAYKISSTSYTVLAGASVRVKDSVVMQLGMRHRNNTFRISYDLVTSGLKNYSGTRGGFEMGFTYCGWN